MKIFRKLLRKKIVITIIIILVISYIGFMIFGGNGGPEYILEKVTYGNVVKEVSETGMVKVSEQAGLSFRNSGKIDEIYIEVGDIVSAGQKLAKLDTNKLYIELTEAQAALGVVNADYSRLLAGSSGEEIKVAETEVNNAQVTFDNSEQSLQDIKIDAEQDLDNAYEDAANSLDDAYLKIYNALNVVDDVKRTYFGSSDQESIAVSNNTNKIKNALSNVKSYIDDIEQSFDWEKVDSALVNTKDDLADVRDALEEVRDATESGNYRNDVSSADKTLLDNQKSYINTAHSNIADTKQDISTTKITNETNINTAEATVSLAEVALQKAEDQLNLKKAGPTPENINLYLAKIEQAKARVSLLHNNINEAVLKSPADGQITAINKRKGETVSSADPVIGFLLSGPFQIEVDVYEEDIVDIQVNNYIEVILPAFPDDIFKGKVISVDPAEKLVGGVVYYEVNISFEIQDQNIKPGMTADVIIETDKKENVLVVPVEAVEKRDEIKVAKMYVGKQLVYRTIEVGLEGEDHIEILSGLSEGEMVIIGEKQK